MRDILTWYSCVSSGRTVEIVNDLKEHAVSGEQNFYDIYTEEENMEPPAYACVGTSDGIAYYGTMQERIKQIQAQGTNAEIEIFEGLPHGFGLGEGTVAKGWFDHAVRFWEDNMTK